MDERFWVMVLIELRWPHGWRCARCGADEHYLLKSRVRMIQCKGCHAQRSVTSGTSLKGVRRPLGDWIFAMAEFSTFSGISARRLARKLGVHVQTAFRMLHRVRACLAEEQPLLEGECTQVLGLRNVVGPCVDPAPEIAYLVDGQGQARVLLGNPRVERTIGLEGWERWRPRFNYRNAARKRGIPPAGPSTTGPARDAVFAADATVHPEPAPGSPPTTPKRRGKPVAALLHAQLDLRIEGTYLHVSGKWAKRYADAAARLFSMWCRYGDWREVLGGAPAITRETLRACLNARPAPFRALVPDFAPRPGLQLTRPRYVSSRLAA